MSNEVFFVTLHQSCKLMQEIKHISNYRESLKGRIVDVAMDLFCKYGVKAVKMDDIASELAISKRTLYEIYDNKETVLYEGLRRYHETARQQMEAYAQQAESIMDILLFFYRRRNREYQTTSPLFYEDIQKYPRVTEFLADQRQLTYEQLQVFLERGVAEGYFRPEVNYRLVNHLFGAMGGYVRDHHLKRQYSSEELFDNVVIVILRGVSTQKGIDALERFFEVKMQEKAAFL